MAILCIVEKSIFKGIGKMKNPKLTIIGLMMCSFFSGCKSEKEQVRDNIEQMKSRPIELCLDKMECRRNPLSKLGKKFTMVVYVDSAVCSPCALGKLRFWNPLISEAKKERIDIDYVFILSPKKEELEDVNMDLEITDLQSSVYLDTENVFQRSNVTIPKGQQYHSFLLDKEFNVILIGSPIEKEKIKCIYKRIISGKCKTKIVM